MSKVLTNKDKKSMQAGDSKHGPTKRPDRDEGGSRRAGTRSTKPVSHLHPRVTGIIAAMKPLMQRKSVLLQKKKDFDAKYVSLDAKGSVLSTEYDEALKNVELELKALRGVYLGAFGTRALRIPLAFATTLSNTAANLNRNVLLLDVAGATDFASFAALFDEVRTESCKIRYLPASWATSTAVLGASQNPTGVYAYDATDAGVLASLGAGVQFSTHHVYDLGVIETGTGACIHQTQRSLMEVRVPSGVLEEPTGSTATVCIGNAWASTISTGNVDPVGFIKWFEPNALATGIIIGTAVIYYDAEFRMRN